MKDQLLEAMGLGTEQTRRKYPEAIPLKRVDVESVAEGLCEVFSRHGEIPKRTLSRTSNFEGGGDVEG